MASNSPLIEVRQLSIATTDEKRKILVKEISFKIETGQCLGLVGESGSGKSLTALSLLQLLPLNLAVSKKSQILFNGDDLLSYSEKKMRQVRGKKISIIFQDAMSALNPVLTIGQQINEVLHFQKQLSFSDSKKVSLELLREVGISQPERCLVSYPHELSGGMRQRAMIAIALSADPELLIADEPTTALDVTLQGQILTLLKRLQKSRQMALLFISHHLVIVGQLANEIVVLQKGKVIEKAPVQIFFIKPREFYTDRISRSWRGACDIEQRSIHSVCEQRDEHATKPELERRSVYTQELLAASLPMKHFLPSLCNPGSLLSVNNLTVHFPIVKGILKRTVGFIKAVNEVSLEIGTGETVALIGESGSGKTTVAKAILKLVTNTSGKIIYKGLDLNKLSSRKIRSLRSELQMIFQDPFSALNPKLVIAVSLLEGMKAQNLIKNKSQALKEIDYWLEQVELTPQVKFRYPHEFSGGERQRLCIARALTLKPKLLVLDEPTSALDLTIQKQILDLLRDLQQKLELSFLLITHDMSVVAYMANRVAVMHQGYIVETGEVKDVLTKPQHVYTQELLKSVPRLSNF